MGVVDQAIQDGIGQGGIPDLGAPFIHRELSGHESGTEALTIFEEFHEVPALFVGQEGQSPIGCNAIKWYELRLLRLDALGVLHRLRKVFYDPLNLLG